MFKFLKNIINFFKTKNETADKNTEYNRNKYFYDMQYKYDKDNFSRKKLRYAKTDPDIIIDLTEYAEYSSGILDESIRDLSFELSSSDDRMIKIYVN